MHAASGWSLLGVCRGRWVVPAAPARGARLEAWGQDDTPQPANRCWPPSAACWGLQLRCASYLDPLPSSPICRLVLIHLCQPQASSRPPAPQRPHREPASLQLPSACLVDTCETCLLCTPVETHRPLPLLQAPEEVIQLHADLRAYDKLGQAHLQTALRSVAALAEMGSSTRPGGQGTSAADLDRMQVMQTLTDAANQFNQVGSLKFAVLCMMSWVNMSSRLG